MAMPVYPDVNLPTPDKEHPLAQATVAFAVDRSGSTHGRTLECEVSFIKRVSQLLAADRRSSVRVVPWDNRVDNVVGLQGLEQIKSRGGTEPDVILQNPVAKAAVLGASLWFLMTDGLIMDRDQERFANLVPEAGVHGITCIPVIFGNTTRNVISCNISVGISLFSICPNSMFLFYDIASHEIKIMQSKGVFTPLLKGTDNPVIDWTTSWSSFPRLSLQALSDIVIPAPKKLRPDEVALQGSLVVNFNDLWANKLSNTQLNDIFSNGDNLNTITMAAQSRGARATTQFQSWVQQQQMPVQDPLWRQRSDKARQAMCTYLELVGFAKDNKPLPCEIRERLRHAHLANMKEFLRSCGQQVREANYRNVQIQQSHAKSASKISSAGALNGYQSMRPTSSIFTPMQRNSTPVSVRSDVSSTGNGFVNVQSFLGNGMNSHPPPIRPSAGTLPSPASPESRVERKRSFDRFQSTKTLGEYGENPRPGDGWTALKATITDPALRHLLYTPGFRCGKGSFKGACGVCGEAGVTLAWLFNAPMAKQSAGPGTPESPLAFGVSPKAGIISPLPCCESCSTFGVATGKSPSDTVFAALPMVGYGENQQQYDQLLDRVFRLSANENLTAFLSILLNTAQRNTGSQLFQDAVSWTCNDLIKHIRISSGSRCLIQELEQAADLGSTLVCFKLPEFVTLLRAASTTGIDVEIRHAIAFRRYLFSLTESLVSVLAEATVSRIREDILRSIDKYLWEEDPDLVLVSVLRPEQPHSAFQTQETSRNRVLSIPMSTLRGGPLLSEEAYQLLNMAEDFRSVGTNGCATAIFLHALMDVMEKHVFTTAGDLFKLVLTRKELAPIFANPKDIDIGEVVSMLKLLHL